MSFPKKTWKNRISDEPSRRLLTPTNGGDAYTVDVTRAEGTITQEGDAFNAANMNDLENRIEAAIGGGTDLLAPTEATSTTSKPYSVNEYVIYDNKYYRVTAAIPQGGSLVPGTNITEDPVGTALTRIIGVNNTQNTNITNLGNQLRSAGASGTNFYFDYKNGKYGWNSSSARGADTFHPFKQAIPTPGFISITNEGETASFVVPETGSYYLYAIGASGSWSDHSNSIEIAISLESTRLLTASDSHYAPTHGEGYGLFTSNSAVVSLTQGQTLTMSIPDGGYNFLGARFIIVYSGE